MDGGLLTHCSHAVLFLYYLLITSCLPCVRFIEINTNPSISYQNAWHEGMVDTMLEHMFQLIVDPVFPGAGKAPAVLVSPDLIPMTQHATATAVSTAPRSAVVKAEAAAGAGTAVTEGATATVAVASARQRLVSRPRTVLYRLPSRHLLRHKGRRQRRRRRSGGTWSRAGSC